jgi:hypothetical protein
MPIQLNPIEAHERTIGQIFDDAYAFEIPSYQRPYAWEIEQASELPTDLTNAMADTATGGVYFLGSIVLIKSPSDPQSWVIDGQQRLTTLTILLSVLRDLTTDNEKRIDRRRCIFQKANPDRGTSDRFRILLRKRDRPFFLKTVQQPDATNVLPEVEQLEGSQRQIARNAQYFREQLESMDEAKRDSLIAFIIQRCYLVVVAVPTAEAARRIFTVLSARGLDLTPTDILKADLLDRAGEAAGQALADRWETVELAVSRDGLVELFGHVRMIYEREKPRLALEIAFPKFVTPFRGGDADQFISNVLEPMADAFRLLKDDKATQRAFGPDAAKAVRSLARVDNKDWVPPAILRLWKRTPGDQQSVADFLIKLERVAYYLFVTRAGVNDRISRFAGVIDEIDPRGTDTGNGLTLTDTEQAEFLDQLDGNIYLKTRVCKPVLQRLDEALSTGGAAYDELVSIEHVLPQTVAADSEWQMLFPDEGQRSTWINRLANLVFLTRRVNTRASNWDFKRKKAEYFSSDDGSSPFVITQEVLRTDKWTPEYLAERQEQLLKKLADVWQLDFSTRQSREAQMESSSSKSTKESTEAVAAKWETIIFALSKREGIQLFQKSGSSFCNEDGTVRAVCAVSKRYPTDPAYWYGYTPQQNEFLSNGKTSFYVLGCMDRNRAYAIPHEKINKLLQYLNRTGDRHWHIHLMENAGGKLELLVPKAETKVAIAEFEIIEQARVTPAE